MPPGPDASIFGASSYAPRRSASAPSMENKEQGGGGPYLVRHYASGHGGQSGRGRHNAGAGNNTGRHAAPHAAPPPSKGGMGGGMGGVMCGGSDMNMSEPLSMQRVNSYTAYDPRSDCRSESGSERSHGSGMGASLPSVIF